MSAIVLGIAPSAALDPKAFGVAGIGPLPPMSSSVPLPEPDTVASPDLPGGALVITLPASGPGIIFACSVAARDGEHRCAIPGP